MRGSVHEDITASVDDETHRLARIRATESETGAILAAARACGCDIVYSEELIAGQDYDGTRVINSFADIPERQG